MIAAGCHCFDFLFTVERSARGGSLHRNMLFRLLNCLSSCTESKILSARSSGVTDRFSQIISAS